MAERRRIRSAVDEKEPAARRPARRREREPADRDELEVVGAEEPEFAEDEEPEFAEDEEPEFAEDEEPVGEADAERAGEGEPARANGRGRDNRRAERRHDPALTAKQAARAALGQIMEMTAKPAEGITEVERTEDGWVVGVEVVEDRRIPSSTDILATYQATIDAEGELMSYRRLRRYMRGRGDTGEAS
jgi:hypothetical protein